MAEMLSVSGGFLLSHRFLGVGTLCVIVHNHYWRRIARAEHACLRIISIFSEYCSQLESICMHFTSLFPVSAPSKHWIEYPVWCSAGRDVHNIHNYAYTSHISPQPSFITETSHLSLSDAGRDKAASAVTARDTRHQTTRPSPRPQLWFFVRFQLLLYINYWWLYSWSITIAIVISHFYASTWDWDACQ